jgi:hypothetical protein
VFVWNDTTEGPRTREGLTSRLPADSGVDSTLFGRTPGYGVSFQTSSLSGKENCVPSCELELSLPYLLPSLPPLPLDTNRSNTVY